MSPDPLVFDLIKASLPTYTDDLSIDDLSRSGLDLHVLALELPQLSKSALMRLPARESMVPSSEP